MPVFEIEKNGEIYEVDAPDEQQALGALDVGSQMGEVRAPRMTDVPFSLRGAAEKTADVLPMAGQIGGGIAGMSAGGPVGSAIGGTVGYAIGETASQLLDKALTGEPFDPDALLRSTAITGAIEASTLGLSKLAFGKFIAKQQAEKLAPVISKTKKSVQSFVQQNPSLKMNTETAYKYMQNFIKKAGGSVDEIPAALRKEFVKGYKTIDGVRTPIFKEALDFNSYSRLKQKLFKVAKPYKDGPLATMSNETRKGLKSAGKYIQAKMEKVATQAGRPEFGKLNSAFSAAQKVAHNSMSRGIADFAIPSSIGGLVGIMSGNPTAGILAGLGTSIGSRDAVRELAFNMMNKGIVGSAIGQTAKAGISEAARKLGE